MYFRSPPPFISFLVFAIVINTISSCATKVGKVLYVDESHSTFYLPEAIPYEKHFLPAGNYRCYYYDDEGKYYEGPASLNEENMFSRGATGGIYIYDGHPIRAHVYIQEKHPSYTYVEGIGAISFGGRGYYIVQDVLPNSITSLINVKKGVVNESQ